MVYAAIKYILDNDTDFATAVGSSGGNVKAYPIGIPPGVAPPFVEFSMLSADGNPSKEQASTAGLDYARVQIRIYSTKVDEAIDIAEKARIAMDNEKAGGTYNSEVVRSVDFDSMSDGVLNFGENAQLFYIDLRFDIWINP